MVARGVWRVHPHDLTHGAPPAPSPDRQFPTAPFPDRRSYSFQQMVVDKSVKKPQTPIRDQLSAAAAETALVRIDRGIKKADRLEGFLLDSGPRWGLIHAESGSWYLDR